MEAMKTVLMIDNNDEYCEALSDVLLEQGIDVVTSNCPDAAFLKLRGMDAPDLIVGDLYMPFTLGVEHNDYKTSYEVGIKALRELAWVFPETPVIALTALEEIDIERVRKLLSPIPAYRKTTDLHRAADLVQSFLDSAEVGGVQ
jgi:CheY-like chemotaxis protein